MRINKFVAQATGLSRRTIDTAIQNGRVKVNGAPAQLGQDVSPEQDSITLDGARLKLSKPLTIMFNKPRGYITSRDGQGGKTIYELLPEKYSALKPVGRLDKDSSGLLLLTNDGDLANSLTHPKYEKKKVYEVTLDKPLLPKDKHSIQAGILIDNQYVSRLHLAQTGDKRQTPDDSTWLITMSQGKNRQIRRTFEALGYKVVRLHRTQFGMHRLESLNESHLKIIGAKSSSKQ